MTPCRARMLVAAQRQRWPKLAAPRHPNDTRRVGILPGRATFVDEGAECHYEPVPVFKIGNDSVMAALPLLPKLADLPWHSEGCDCTTRTKRRPATAGAFPTAETIFGCIQVNVRPCILSHMVSKIEIVISLMVCLS